MKALNQHEKDRLKLEELKSQYQKSLALRNKELLDIMTEMDLGPVSGYTLIGALLDVKNKTQTKDPVCDEWSKQGKTYSRRVNRRSL